MRDVVAPFVRAVTVVLLPWLAASPAGAQSVMVVESGVRPDGTATEQWLAMLRRRLPAADYAEAAVLRRKMTDSDEAWARLIRSRIPEWELQTSAVAGLYDPAPPPGTARIILGNHGASDAFTHDERTVGFDLSALQNAYGDATLPENTERIDRLFRHEYAHLMQKAWLRSSPYPASTPLEHALDDIWKEGLGNYHSMSLTWRTSSGTPSDAASTVLATLAPRFVTRLSALACATPERAAALTADLSSGRFDRKWGALPAALWLDAESYADPDALRRFILAGPEGVWNLADRHLPPGLAAALREARHSADLCSPP